HGKETTGLCRWCGNPTERVVVGAENGISYRVQENSILIRPVRGQPRCGVAEERELHYIWWQIAGLTKPAQKRSLFFQPCILDTRIVRNPNPSEHLPISLADFRVARIIHHHKIVRLAVLATVCHVTFQASLHRLDTVACRETHRVDGIG